MGSWLTTLTAPCCNQLDTMGNKLSKIKERYMYWNDDYYQKAQDLVSRQSYQGTGATAFMQAVDTDINVCRPVYDGIGHASSACHNLKNAMSASSTKYESEMTALTPPYNPQWPIEGFNQWRNQLVQMTLGGSNAAILEHIFENGNSYIAAGYSKAYPAVEDVARQDAETYSQTYIAEWILWQPNGSQINQNNLHHNIPVYPSSNPQPTINTLQLMEIQAEIAQIKQEILAYYLAAFNQLASEIESALNSWAADLYQAHGDFQTTIQSAENYLSARDIYDFINTTVDGSQSTNKPITITPYKAKDGKTGLLISMGGTDLNDWAWDTDLFTALQTGMNADNPYLDDVKKAIATYMNEHREMAGAEITFAGYSLGGMTAQQIAQDIASGNDPVLGQNGYNLHVAQVITYGAPVMGAPLQNVRYEMYDATYDPIPLLSSYENPYISAALLNNVGAPDVGAALGTINAADQMAWDQRLHSYIDPRSQYGNHIHDITDVGKQGSMDIPISLNGVVDPRDPSIHIPIAGNIQNHMMYDQTNQLNAPATATTDINPATFGPTEYFGMKNTDNFYAKMQKSYHPIKNDINTFIKFMEDNPLFV